MSPMPTDTQLEVLKILWDHGPITVRRIAEILYSSCTASDIGTVHTILQRLERKKLLIRDRSTHPHQFSAGISQSELAGRELEEVAQKLTGGSMTPFLTHLLQSNRLTSDEIREIRRMLSDNARKGK